MISLVDIIGLGVVSTIIFIGHHISIYLKLRKKERLSILLEKYNG